MTAVIVAFQRATSDLEMPTTPGRPRDVQVAPQPLIAPGSPAIPRTEGMLPFLLRYESTLMSSLHLYMTGRIQKSDIHLNLVKSAIVHRRTLETLAVLTVPSALSPDAENTRTTMSTALTRLLSRFGDDGCRLLPCDLPREIRKIRISGIVSGYGYDPGRH